MCEHSVIKQHAPKAPASIQVLALGELSAATHDDATAKAGIFSASVL